MEVCDITQMTPKRLHEATGKNRHADRFDYSEQRFVTLGLLEELVVSIVHTETARLIRIISFRKVTKHEQTIFFTNL